MHGMAINSWMEDPPTEVANLSFVDLPLTAYGGIDGPKTMRFSRAQIAGLDILIMGDSEQSHSASSPVDRVLQHPLEPTTTFWSSDWEMVSAESDRLSYDVVPAYFEAVFTGRNSKVEAVAEEEHNDRNEMLRAGCAYHLRERFRIRWPKLQITKRPELQFSEGATSFVEASTASSITIIIAVNQKLAPRYLKKFVLLSAVRHNLAPDHNGFLYQNFSSQIIHKKADNVGCSVVDQSANISNFFLKRVLRPNTILFVQMANHFLPRRYQAEAATFTTSVTAQICSKHLYCLWRQPAIFAGVSLAAVRSDVALLQAISSAASFSTGTLCFRVYLCLMQELLSLELLGYTFGFLTSSIYHTLFFWCYVWGPILRLHQRRQSLLAPAFYSISFLKPKHLPSFRWCPPPGVCQFGSQLCASSSSSATGCQLSIFGGKFCWPLLSHPMSPPQGASSSTCSQSTPMTSIMCAVLGFSVQVAISALVFPLTLLVSPWSVLVFILTSNTAPIGFGSSLVPLAVPAFYICSSPFNFCIPVHWEVLLIPLMLPQETIDQMNIGGQAGMAEDPRYSHLYHSFGIWPNPPLPLLPLLLHLAQRFRLSNPFQFGGATESSYSSKLNLYLGYCSNAYPFQFSGQQNPAAPPDQHPPPPHQQIGISQPVSATRQSGLQHLRSFSLGSSGNDKSG
nr:uncharacterized protein LOC109176829 [Ipomoea batatas]